MLMQNNYCFCIYFTGLRIFSKRSTCISPYTHWKEKFKFFRQWSIIWHTGIWCVQKCLSDGQKYQVGKFFKYLTESSVYLQLLRMYSVTKSIFWLVSKAINTPSVCPHDSIAYTEVMFPVPKTLKQWLPALLYTNCISSHEATIRNKFY